MIPKLTDEIIETWDGQRVRRCSMLIRGVTIAVDLSLAVGVSCLGLFLVSLVIPLDDPAARWPLGLLVGAAMVYLVVGRDLLVSPGRALFGLRLYRLPGNVPGLAGRSLTAWPADAPAPERDPLPRSMFAIVLSTALGALCVAAAMTRTHLFTLATEHLAGAPASGVTAPFRPADFPRALLIGAERGFVQVGGLDGLEEPVVVNVYLVREAGAWRVLGAGRAGETFFAHYSLGIADAEVPRPPG